MFVKMKIKCFSKRKLNVRISKTKIKCAILGFSQICCILGKSREKLVKLSKNSANMKFLIYLCPTRVNFSTASSTTFPHQGEGAALLLGRLPPPFPFSVFPFRPGNPGLFGTLLQPPAPEKKKRQNWALPATAW